MLITQDVLLHLILSNILELLSPCFGTTTRSLSAAYTLFISRLIKTKPSLSTFHPAHQSPPLNNSPLKPLWGILGNIQWKLNWT